MKALKNITITLFVLSNLALLSVVLLFVCSWDIPDFFILSAIWTFMIFCPVSIIMNIVLFVKDIINKNIFQLIAYMSIPTGFIWVMTILFLIFG